MNGSTGLLEDASRHKAATLIQAQFRRYRAQQQYKQQQAAASTIQAHAARFLARREAARHAEQQQRAERFKAIMARYHERIQQLELEKKAIKELNVHQLDAWQAQRVAAAVKIQAHWRGSKQRQQLKQLHPELATLHPVACPSPTLMDQQSFSSTSPLLQSVTAAGFTALQPEPSSSSTTTRAAATAKLGSQASSVLAPQQSGYVRSSRRGPLAAAMLAGEPSSCLSAEASKLSAVSMAVLGQSDAPKRSTALPMAKRMVLERQVQLRIDAFKASANNLAIMRATQQESDQRLISLLEEHAAAAAARLKEVRWRQNVLQEAEVLHRQLQQLPQLSQLPDSLRADHFALAPADSTRTRQAKQAHALALAEARVGSKWWLPLKALNQQHRDAAALGDGGVLQQDWQQQEAAWKNNWKRITEEEEKRLSPAALEQQQLALQPKVLIEQELSSASSTWQVAAKCS